jgi:uncharacterized protein (TIGR02588 family)
MPKALTKKVAHTPILEWVAATVGLLFLLGVLTAIGHDAVTGTSHAVPSVEIIRRTVAKTTGGYVVNFVARNRSGGTAAALEVEGVLELSQGKVEKSTASLDYVPGHSETQGGLYFQSDPRAGRLTLRPLGYQTP